MDHCSNRLASTKWPNLSFGENGGSNHDFWGMQKLRYGNIYIFRSPNAPILLIDKAVQRKISFIKKQNDPRSISPTSTCYNIAFANVSCEMTAALSGWRAWIPYGNKWRLWRMIRCMDMHHSPAWAATWRTKNRDRFWITSWTTSKFVSVTAARGHPTYVSCLTFHTRWNFQTEPLLYPFSTILWR